MNRKHLFKKTTALILTAFMVIGTGQYRAVRADEITGIIISDDGEKIVIDSEEADPVSYKETEDQSAPTEESSGSDESGQSGDDNRSSAVENNDTKSADTSSDNNEPRTSDAADTIADDNSDPRPTDVNDMTADDNSDSRSTDANDTTADDNSDSRSTDAYDTTADDNSDSRSTDVNDTNADDNSDSRSTDVNDTTADDSIDSKSAEMKKSSAENGESRIDDNNNAGKEAEKESSSDKNTSSKNEYIYRLLVGTGNKSIFPKDEVIISEYNGIYLIGFSTEEEREKALEYYKTAADIAEYDDEIMTVADEATEDENTDNNDIDVQKSGDNLVEDEKSDGVDAETDAITILNDILEEEQDNNIRADNVIRVAVIDTGAPEGIEDKTSVIGEEADDDNGHGTKVIGEIISVNPKADIISIKAFDSRGKAKPSDIFAAIMYAIERKVSVINLSGSSILSEDSQVIRDAIKAAADEGIIFVGAAGNNGRNVKFFIPGDVEEALITGACDKEGRKLPASNFGDTVDYYIVADSTSIAAARFTGHISSGKSLKPEDYADIYLPKDIILSDNDTRDKGSEEVEVCYTPYDDVDTLSNRDRGSSWDKFFFKSTSVNNNPLIHLENNLDIYNANSGYGNLVKQYEKYLQTSYYAGATSDDNFAKVHPGYFVRDGEEGLNCTAFPVWVLRNMGVEATSISSTIGYPSIGSIYSLYRWTNWIRDKVIDGQMIMYNYSSIDELLREGRVKKGDLIIFEPTISGTQDSDGMHIDHHIGFYWGDSPGENLFWHSTDTEWYEKYGENLFKGAADHEGNKITGLQPKVKASRVWVLPGSAFEYYMYFEKTSEGNTSMDGIEYTITNSRSGQRLCTAVLDTAGHVKGIKNVTSDDHFRIELRDINNRKYIKVTERVDDSRIQKWDITLNVSVEETFVPSNLKLVSNFGTASFKIKNGLSNAQRFSKAENTIFYNLRGKGLLEIYKVDEAGRPLAGAVFRVKQGDKIIADLTTVTDDFRQGYCILAGLEPGQYTVQEITAPDGYSKDDSIYEVTINADKTFSYNGYYYGYVYDSDAYKMFNKDLREMTSWSDKDYFNHFLVYGMNEYRTAAYNISGYVYRENYADLSKAYGDDYPKYYYHYINAGIKENRMGMSASYYAGLEAGKVHHDNSVSVLIKAGNKKKTYYIGINKFEAGNENKPIAATFDIYGTDKAGVTSGGKKIEKLSGKSTDSKTGKLKIDVTEYYNTKSEPVTGKYRYFYAVETKTDSGHDITIKAKALKIGEAVSYTNWENAPKVYISMTKSAANRSCIKDNPNYSLEGTTYGLYATAEDATNNKNIIHTFTIDSKGNTTVYNIPEKYMDINTSTGKYKSTTFYLHELKAGKGFSLSSQTLKVNVSEKNTKDNPAVVNAEDSPTINTVKIEINKYDIDGKASPQGTGSLEGAEFLINYYPVDVSVKYSEAQLSKLKAAASWRIKTKYNKSTKLYTAELNKDWLTGSGNSPFYYEDGGTTPVLPYGYLVLKEVKAPQGYETAGARYRFSNLTYDKDDTVVVCINSVGSITVEGKEVTGQISAEDKPIRGDILISKKDINGNAMKDVEFEIRSETTGESYIVKTDEDGIIDSEKSELWFGKKIDGSFSKRIEGLGALPCGKYTVKELRCEANNGKLLEPLYSFTVTESKVYRIKDSSISGNDITNADIPVIGTKAGLTGSDSKYLPKEQTVSVTDIISYSSLRAGTTYTLLGRIAMVDDNGNVSFYEKDGEEYRVTKQFKTPDKYQKTMYECSGEETMIFNVDTKDIESGRIVIFERLYLGDTIPENDEDAAQYDENPGIFPLIHEDINSADQTLYNPEMKTKAVIDDESSKDGKEIEIDLRNYDARKKVNVTDVVSYKNLIPGEYEIRGVLMDKEKNKQYKVGDESFMVKKTFTVTQSSGEVSVVFEIPVPDTKDNKELTLVVFEELYETGDEKRLVTEHKNINDNDQTIKVIVKYEPDKPEDKDQPPEEKDTPKEQDKPEKPVTPEKPSIPEKPVPPEAPDSPIPSTPPSTYVVPPDNPKTPETPNKPPVPSTSDEVPIGLIAALAFLSIGGAIIIKRKKDKNSN